MINFPQKFFCLVLFLAIASGCGSDLVSDSESGEDSIFIIPGGYAAGNSGYTHFVNLCESALNNFDDPSMGNKQVKPFLSSAVGGPIDELMPANSNKKVRSMLNGGLRVVDQWADLWADPLEFINPISPTNSYWYSGSTVQGGQLDSGSCGNGLWTDSPFGGVIGQTGANNGLWINYQSASCSESHQILCLVH